MIWQHNTIELNVHSSFVLPLAIKLEQPKQWNKWNSWCFEWIVIVVNQHQFVKRWIVEKWLGSRGIFILQNNSWKIKFANTPNYEKDEEENKTVVVCTVSVWLCYEYDLRRAFILWHIQTPCDYSWTCDFLCFQLFDLRKIKLRQSVGVPKSLQVTITVRSTIHMSKIFMHRFRCNSWQTTTKMW